MPLQNRVRAALLTHLGSLVRGANSTVADRRDIWLRSRIQVIGSVRYYYLADTDITLDDILTIARKDKLIGPDSPERVDTRHVFDCDNYTFRLRNLVALAYDLDFPLALGCLLTDVHAWNFVLKNRSELILIDTHSRILATESTNYRQFLSRPRSSGRIEFIFV